eukprot:193356-Rhodomonas_salina.1
MVTVQSEELLSTLIFGQRVELVVSMWGSLAFTSQCSTDSQDTTSFLVSDDTSTQERDASVVSDDTTSFLVSDDTSTQERDVVSDDTTSFLAQTPRRG